MFQIKLMNINGLLTGESFLIKYRDIEGYLDFLVLKQMYDKAIKLLKHFWKPGVRFRTIIIDKKKPDYWFEGVFKWVKHYKKYPDSNIDCCYVK